MQINLDDKIAKLVIEKVIQDVFIAEGVHTEKGNVDFIKIVNDTAYKIVEKLVETLKEVSANKGTVEGDYPPKEIKS